MGFHTHIPLEQLTVDQALIYLRSRIYDDDRKSIVALFLKRPDLGRAGLITDYVWTHLGRALIEPMLEGQAAASLDASIIERLPAAAVHLDAIASDSDNSDRAREAASQILSRLRAHQGMSDKESEMAGFDDLDDLFGPTDTDEESEGGQKRLELRPVEGAPRSQIVEFAGNDVSISIKEENDSGQLHITGTLMNLLDTAVEFNELQLVLRREDGALLDIMTHYMNSRFKRAQEIVAEIHFGADILNNIGQIDIRANFNFEFRTRLASGKVARIESGGQYYRNLWEVEMEKLETPAGLPNFDLEVACYYGAHYDELCEFVIQLTDLSPSTDMSRETVVALRDEAGKVIAKESNWGSFPAGSPVVFKVTPYLEGKKLKSVDRIDIAVKGNCRKNELIGSFAVTNRG